MKQLWLIFRKDVRHLWLSIVALILLMAAHAFFDVLTVPIGFGDFDRDNAVANLLAVVLAIGIAALVALVIFEEALPGDKQFWLTRPYRWTNLLAAKVLFVFVFVSVPLFVSDCCILGVQGLAVASVLPQLLLRQLILAAEFVLPSFAIASVTKGLAQFLLAWFLLLLAVVGEVTLGFTGSRHIVFFGGDGLVFSPLAVFVGTVVWQYATRRTLVGRSMLIGTTCGFLPIALLLSYVPAFRPTEPPPVPEQAKGFDIRIGYDIARKIPNWRGPLQTNSAVLPISLGVTGLPAGDLLRGSAKTKMSGTVEANTEFNGIVQVNSEGYWLMTFLSLAKLKEIRDKSVSLHTSFRLEVVADVGEIVAVKRPRFLAPHLGICGLVTRREYTNLICRSGLDVMTEVSVATAGGAIMSTQLGNIPFGLTPMKDVSAMGFRTEDFPTSVKIIPRHKLAEFQRTLDLKDVQLGKLVD